MIHTDTQNPYEEAEKLGIHIRFDTIAPPCAGYYMSTDLGRVIIIDDEVQDRLAIYSQLLGYAKNDEYKFLAVQL